MTNKPKYIPAVVGEVRGPWDSSPGNPFPWQAAYYTGNGWCYSFSKISPQDARQAAEREADGFMAAATKKE